MRKKINWEDRVGDRHGRLTILSFTFHDGRMMANCICDCGNTTQKRYDSIYRPNNTRSCGCLHIETAAKKCKGNASHGLRKHSLYGVWAGMKQRCYNPLCPIYKWYGGKGVKMCDEWVNDFKSFYIWAMENKWSRNLEIDRKESDGNYEPSNCRCVTSKVNNRNKKNNSIIEYNGIIACISEWSEITGLKQYIISQRLRANWRPEDIFTIPVKKQYNYSNEK